MVAAAPTVTNRTTRVDAKTRCRNVPNSRGASCSFSCTGTATDQGIATRQMMRRVLQTGGICVLGALSLLVTALVTVASADTLDRSRVSGLIETTAQAIGQPFPGVHIQVLDPADHLRGGTADGERMFDASSLLKLIDRQIAVPLGVVEAMTIGRHAAFAFFNREMATSVHALSNGSTLCTVFPMPAPVRLAELAAMLSGNDETEAIAKLDFDAEDFYRFLLYHEVAHCDEDPWRIRTRGLGPYDIYLAESRADAFAVLMHMKRTGNASLPRFMVSVRRNGMAFRGDVEHQTAAVIEPTIAFATKLHLTGLFDGTSLMDLMRAARALAHSYALGRADFEAQSRPQAVGQKPRR